MSRASDCRQRLKCHIVNAYLLIKMHWLYYLINSTIIQTESLCCLQIIICPNVTESNLPSILVPPLSQKQSQQRLSTVMALVN